MRQINCRGFKMQLLAEKAIFLPEQKSLWLADTHFGKVKHFRKSGIAVPTQAAQTNLNRFKRLLEKYQPKEVVFLGDLFHSDYNREWDTFSMICEGFTTTKFHLIQGNHDVLEVELYSWLQLHIEPMIWENTFSLTHEPQNTKYYNVAGHIHPAVRLQGLGKQSAKLPCFYFGKEGAILPAFGEFTGFHTLKPKSEEKIFGVSGDEVLELN